MPGEGLTKASLFCEGHELGWRDAPKTRVLPAEQGLDARDPPVRESHSRLVVQLKPPIG